MQLSVVLPTYNEKENIPIICERLQKALKNIEYEIIIVDDNSPDGTYQAALELSESQPHILPIKRVHEKGLSSAVVRGFSVARGKYLAVMDADLQHDETILPTMLAEFEKGSDLVIGSRKVEGGGIENWSAIRKFISWGATLLAKIMLPYKLSDPMSGFFAIRKSTYEQVADKVNPRGFKILLELVNRARDARISEVGFVFKPRVHGESKLSGKVMIQYLVALYDLRFGRILPIRFIKFGMVGSTGVLVNEGGLWFGLNVLGWQESYALALGIEISIITNFLLNNFYTFRDVKLTGFLPFIRGLITFNLICSAGAVVNYAVALFTKEKLGITIYAGNLLGILAATAWNYLINFQITWKGAK